MMWNRQRKVRVATRPLMQFLRRVEKELALDKAGVTVCFVSDAEIARMNQAFRGKPGPTDVLSFPADEQKRRVTSGEWRAKKRPDAGSAQKKRRKSRVAWEDSYLGDIAIAPQTARRYAKKNGRTLDTELRVLILHGVLHLLGYDHETDRGEMDRLEQKLRRRFGLL